MADELPESYSFKPSEDKPECEHSWGLTDHGTATYTNGDKFTGYFVDGKKHGHGTYIFKNGDEYEGPYVDNVRCGVGMQKNANGSRYHGNFQNGKKHGEGTYFYVNGDKYCGQWLNGQRHGEGIYVFDDNTKKDGIKKCQCSYQGIWEKGQFKNGKYLLGDKVYTGEFSKQKTVGDGVWSLNGCDVRGTYLHQELPVDSAPDDLKVDPSQEVRVTWVGVA